MNPRAFLSFFKTRTGRLLLFALLLAGGLALYARFRESEPATSSEPLPKPKALPKTAALESIDRPMEPLRIPVAKPEPPHVIEIYKTNYVTLTTSNKLPAVSSPMLSLYSEVPDTKAPGTAFAPFGRLIPCETVITVDSASIQTPIIGLVTEDIFHGGRRIIEAGTEVHGTAQTDHHRERIAGGTSWTLVWQGGEELRIKALALDREFSSNQEGWGITDGSAGLRGRLIKTDDMAEIRLFASSFLAGISGALTEKQPTIFGSMDNRSLNNAPIQGAERVLTAYAQRIQEAIQRDGFYVRVPSGKQFYLYVLQTLERAEATRGATLRTSDPTESFTTTNNPNMERLLP